MMPMTVDRVVLRYFPVLGRAQALRLTLADRQVAFEDVRPTGLDWPRLREDATFGGPFRALPMLSWGDDHVAETLPIASYIAKRSGQYQGLSDAAIARIEAICSCCLMDVTLRVAEMLRADTAYPGSDAPRAFAGLVPRLMPKLELLDAELGAAEWFGGKEPVTADFFATEAIDVVAHALGPMRQAALDARLPQLTSLARRVRQRPALAKVYETRPTRITPRPDEDVIIERMRASDLSAARL
jgi:glutathione S-transferase